jgi:hypothetical protein
LVPRIAPFFGHHEAPIDEAFREVQLPSVPNVFDHGFEHLLQYARTNPLLEPTVAGLVRGIPVGQILPASAGLQDPENPVEHFSGILPGTASTIGALPGSGDEGLEHFPLGIGQFHRLLLRLGEPTGE